MLGLTESGTRIKAFENSINEFSNGVLAKSEIKIITNKVQNYAMNGLFVAIDITGLGSVNLE